MDEMVPSICGSIFCVGHSFPEGRTPFIPIVKLNPSNKVFFKPCSKGESVYQTIEFINQTDTPCFYKFNASLNKNLRVFPKSGMIEAKSFRLIVLEFSPDQVGVFHKNLSVSLNHS